jgi:hypothetical protein
MIFDKWEARWLMLSGITIGAALFASGAASLGLILHLMGKL